MPNVRSKVSQNLARVIRVTVQECYQFVGKVDSESMRHGRNNEHTVLDKNKYVSVSTVNKQVKISAGV